MKKIRFAAFALFVLLIVTAVPFNSAFAGQDTVEQTEVFPEIVEISEIDNSGYVERLRAEEQDLNTLVFQNSDNTRTMKVYSHPVKYMDKDGNIKDISLDIQAQSDGSFKTKENSIQTVFGKKAVDGITLSEGDVCIKLVPESGGNASLSQDSKVVTYTVDEKTSLEYSLTYTGFKEDIVVEEYTGKTEYEFLLYTNGLTLTYEGMSYFLADSEGNKKAAIGDIIVFTADERNNTFGSLSYREVKPNQIYLLTIHVDSEFLSSPDTAYPIRIDPTIELNPDGNGAIEDVTIYTGTSYYSGTSGTLYVGTDNGLVYRSLMTFPDLYWDLRRFDESQIISAYVEIRDLMCQSTVVPIECLSFLNTTAWSENGTNTWSTFSSATVNFLDVLGVYYGNGNATGDSQRYSFNITEAVKEWVRTDYTLRRGLMFKTIDSVENAASNGMLKYFGSYNRSDYKPSITIRYNSPIYYAVLHNRFDNGYLAYHQESSTNSINNINNYTSAVTTKFYNLFGLSITVDTAAYPGVSLLDGCKGTVTRATVDLECSHYTENENKDSYYLKVAEDVRADFTSGYMEAVVYWTGHKVMYTNALGQPQFNRSFATGNYIFMLMLAEGDARFEESASTLMHELAHKFGASDHYHESTVDDDEPCGNLCCITCNNTGKYSSNCVMYDHSQYYNSEEPFCNGCKEDIMNYLRQHGG